jgi:hypothetical protein
VTCRRRSSTRWWPRSRVRSATGISRHGRLASWYRLGWLVGLDDQQVGGLLDADQPVSVGVLGVQRVRGDHPPGQVQPLQQGPEPGDLVGGVVHVGLGQDRTAGVIHRRQQLHLGPAVVAAAAGSFRRPRPPAAASRAVVAAGQPARRRWRGRGRRGRFGPARGARWPRRVAARRRSAGRGAPRARPAPGRARRRPTRRSRPGNWRRPARSDRDGQHRGQRVPSAAPVAWVGDLGEVVEQVTVLVGRQHGGSVQPLGDSGNGG